MQANYLKGAIQLSKLRRAQKKYQNTSLSENTIDFNKAKFKYKRIDLLPKTITQESLILNLIDPKCYVSVAVGPAGTGKSYLAILAALKSLKEGSCEKIVLTRPAVGVEEEKHGFLPGDLNDKMEPWTRPLLDIMKEFYSPQEVKKMIENETIEISPLAFMRGRTFKNSWIVADEMQNATPNQIKMLLTRIGEGSRIVVTGDVEQTDKTQSNNGLLDLVTRLKRNDYDGLRVTQFESGDIQRHHIIDKVLKIYSN